MKYEKKTLSTLILITAIWIGWKSISFLTPESSPVNSIGIAPGFDEASTNHEDTKYVPKNDGNTSIDNSNNDLETIDHRPSQNPLFEVEVRDALGGVIEGASVHFRKTLVGHTNKQGRVVVHEQLRSETKLRSSRSSTSTIQVEFPGYSPVSKKRNDAIPFNRVVIRLVPESTIHGQVVVKHDRVSQSQPQPPVQVSAKAKSVWTDRKGAFVLNALAPGSYQLTARSEHAYGISEPIELGIGESIYNVLIEMNEAYCATGQVTVGGETQHSLSHFKIDNMAVPIQENGNFKVCGLAPGRYAVSPAPQGHGGFYYAISSQFVEIVDKDSSMTVDFGSRSDVAVVLMDTYSRPISDARLFGEITVEDGPTVTGPCVTDENGQCTFESLPQGTLLVRSENHLFSPMTVLVPTPEIVTIKIEHAVTHLQGQLLDRSGRYPIGSRFVILEPLDSPSEETPSPLGAIVEEDGYFNLVAIPAQPYHLGVRDRTSSDSSYEFEEMIHLLENKPIKNKKIRLPIDLIDVHGQVIDQDRSPLPDVKVEANPWEGRGVTSLSDEEGRFVLGKILPTKPLQIRASHPQFASVLVDIPISKNGTLNGQDIVIQMPSSGQLRVTVAEGFPCSITAGSGNLYVQKTVSKDGAAFHKLPVGETPVAAYCSDHIERRSTATIRAGEWTLVQL